MMLSLEPGLLAWASWNSGRGSGRRFLSWFLVLSVFELDLQLQRHPFQECLKRKKRMRGMQKARLVDNITKKQLVLFSRQWTVERISFLKLNEGF